MYHPWSSLTDGGLYGCTLLGKLFIFIFSIPVFCFKSKFIIKGQAVHLSIFVFQRMTFCTIFNEYLKDLPSFHVKSTDFLPFLHGPPPILLKFGTLVGIV